MHHDKTILNLVLFLLKNICKCSIRIPNLSLQLMILICMAYKTLVLLSDKKLQQTGLKLWHISKTHKLNALIGAKEFKFPLTDKTTTTRMHKHYRLKFVQMKYPYITILNRSKQLKE